MKAIDMTKIYRDYKGKWVALTPDRKTVITSGSTAKQVYDEAHKKGFEEPILTKIPTEVVILVGLITT
ncbi:hypothetical protein HYU92_02375 [Candidatus Curtissbacteria bacterium]|nr:hypothetical protein [Candidatus Curtissbacteria bacterium]